MTPDEIRSARKNLGFTQKMMAEEFGLSLRGYEELEAGRSEWRQIHMNALIGVCLRFYGQAANKAVPDFMPVYIRAAMTHVD